MELKTKLSPRRQQSATQSLTLSQHLCRATSRVVNAAASIPLGRSSLGSLEKSRKTGHKEPTTGHSTGLLPLQNGTVPSLSASITTLTNMGKGIWGDDRVVNHKCILQYAASEHFFTKENEQGKAHVLFFHSYDGQTSNSAALQRPFKFFSLERNHTPLRLSIKLD